MLYKKTVVQEATGSACLSFDDSITVLFIPPVLLPMASFSPNSCSLCAFARQVTSLLACSLLFGLWPSDDLASDRRRRRLLWEASGRHGARQLSACQNRLGGETHAAHQQGDFQRVVNQVAPQTRGSWVWRKSPMFDLVRHTQEKKTVFHNGSISAPQIMKEWAEADNQSKTLPKVERQALNEVIIFSLDLFFPSLTKTKAIAQPAHMSCASISSLCCRRWRSRWPVRGRGWWRPTWSGWRPSSTTTAVWPWRTTWPPCSRTLHRSALHLLRVWMQWTVKFMWLLSDSVPDCVVQPERVLQALKRYMAAEQKDRRHTLRHYQHIVAVDPQKAEQMKFQVCVCLCFLCKIHLIHTFSSFSPLSPIVSEKLAVKIFKIEHLLNNFPAIQSEW